MFNYKWGDRAARELANKFGAGRATLVAGTVTISEPATTSTSVILLTRTVAGGAGVNDTIQYAAGTITAGTGFVINAIVAAGTVNTTDTSVVSYLVINP